MIALISGQIASVTARGVVVETGGVGYEVQTTKDTLARLPVGSAVRFFTHHVVREDVEELYGFLTAEELSTFKLLLNVSGVGPKSALNILDVAKPDDIRRAVVNQDAAKLHAVHGIGKKTAERLVVELKDKIEGVLPTATLGDDQSLIEAITSLGYSLNEARQALQSLKGFEGSLEEKIKMILKGMGRN